MILQIVCRQNMQRWKTSFVFFTKRNSPVVCKWDQIDKYLNSFVTSDLINKYGIFFISVHENIKSLSGEDMILDALEQNHERATELYGLYTKTIKDFTMPDYIMRSLD